MSQDQYLKDPDITETTGLMSTSDPDAIIETGAQEIFESVITDEDHEGENEDVRWLREERLHHKTLNWFYRPSAFMITIALLLCFLGMGTSLGPRVTLTLDSICKKIQFEDSSINEQCHDPRIQSELLSLQSALLVVNGFCGCTLSGLMGNLSDRYGRKHVLSVVTIVYFLGRALTGYLISPNTTYNRYYIILANILEGSLGGTTVIMNIANSYITDIVEPHQRNVSIGFIFGTLYAGLAFGPQFSNLILFFRPNDNVLTIYFECGLILLSIFVIVFLLPESRSVKLRRKSQSSHLQRKASFTSIESTNSNISNFSIYNKLQLWRISDIFSPLKLLWIPKHRKYGLGPRINILLLLLIENIMFLATTTLTTALVTYATYMFDWKSQNISSYASILGGTKTACLFIVSPILMHYLKKKLNQNTKSVDNLDRLVIGIALIFDSLGPLTVILATNGSYLYASAAFASMAALGGPTIQSSLVKHVSESHSGGLFGASSLVRNGVLTILSPILLWINGKALAVFPTLLFWIMFGLFICAIIAVFLLKSYDASLDTNITPSQSISSFRSNPRPTTNGSSSSNLQRQLNYGSTSQPSSPRR
ncbi:putative membrane protein [Wickerhamomyces ciferrii]|uniref:Membrane protein n=1 Tax=Wickerhamomyces ciferrii (strain ATCC 14091 / BCRC 22168 / CBS 111 / JCM 3599 / NBRC 0793 / NRRL Y-1031 F-60-10) TaxID=1206466 RepID=K0KXL0_WICCF|nr:uncharacterized protein BN7_5810 [Wickerhamomyces ciferrii]CCH46219.1 putative membrane protein [Wickerhamomyces ciferrii]